MIYGIERLTDELTQELDEMFHAYYSVTPAHTDLPPYDYDWSLYKTLDEAGVLLIITARDEHEDHKLCGAAQYFLISHPHHRGLRMGEGDSIAVDHTRRGEGIGSTLLRFAEAELRKRKVNKMVHGYRTCYGTTPLYEKHGFKEWQRSYMKDLV